MRQRFVKGGLENFAPHEALELLLFYAIPRRDVNPLAHQLIKRFGSLSAVLTASTEQLQQEIGITENAATLLTLIAPLVQFAEKDMLGEKPFMRNLREARALCRTLFTDAKEERFYVICLDAQGRVTRAVKVFSGTIDEITVYPRKVLETAFRYNAHAVVLMHNHPSGVAEPSAADIETTNILRDALEKVDIRLQDHLIYAEGQCVSISQWEQQENLRPLFASASRAADAQRKRTKSTGTAIGEHDE